MVGFLIKRLLQAIFVVIAITLVVSFAIRLTGDPALMMFQGGGSMTEDDLARIRASLGTDRPFIVQYWNFLTGLITLDLGRSFSGGTSVSRLIGDAVPATLLLAFISMAVSIALSIPLGIKAATTRGKLVDQAIRILSLVGLSFPNFWLATMLVLLFAITLGWLPPSGMSGAASYVMPAVTMGVILTATNVRLVRTAMLETLQSQYIPLWQDS
ncbi:ABC transporter permease [Brenneria tiliae]|uniref:ABC transporter permease n=1 Tax=Brenneria tiliae TaxID=2914984 RepID=UPI0020149FE0|nr:ABC transporter permease [Brenneria tiliae]MCL2898394.1 ABC transporter permease [Brenneria tiliae]MCL2903064.1 ABC transporter permease [Brenneria tiliae]